LVERKLGRIEKVDILGSPGPNKLFKMGKFSSAQGSVNRIFVTVALGILGLF